MVNRLGQEFSMLPTEAVDRTRVYIAQTLLKKPIVDFQFDDGIIRFSMPFQLSPEDMKNARLLRSRWAADALGGFIVHSNLDRLSDIACRSDYAELAGRGFHTGFGLTIRSQSLEFACHCQLLNQIWNERLRWELKEVLR